MTRDSTALGLDLAVLMVAAPPLYFPGWFPSWSVAAALVVLAMGWILRRVYSGTWWRGTPVDLALLLLFAMVPVALWAAPTPLRAEYSLPRSYILVWNVALFAAVVAHGSRFSREDSAGPYGWTLAGFITGAMLIALAAPFGMNWLNKFRWLAPLLARVPSVFVGVFEGAEKGFSGNQTAGVLLYALPLLMALVIAGLRHGGPRTVFWWLTVFCGVWMGGVYLLAQSRGGLLGLAAASAAMLILLYRRGWWLLLGSTVLLLLVLPALPATTLDIISDAPVEAVGGIGSLTSFRPTVWNAALLGIQDFAFTGMGFGTFREVVHLLYPLPGISPEYDIAHAHNFFIQTALDFGLPGLVAILAIYLVAVARVIHLWGNPAVLGAPLPPYVTWRVVAIGFAGCLIGQTVYSQFDAVAIGAKPSFLWWYLLALILAAGNLTSTDAGQISYDEEIETPREV